MSPWQCYFKPEAKISRGLTIISHNAKVVQSEREVSVRDKLTATFVLTLVAASQVLTPAQSAGLSGDKGKVRGMARYPSGGCGKLFQSYIDASGHSAFATTATSQYGAFICGVALNKKTTEAAEKEAVAACQRGNSRFKAEQMGSCSVGASK